MFSWFSFHSQQTRKTRSIKKWWQGVFKSELTAQNLPRALWKIYFHFPSSTCLVTRVSRGAADPAGPAGRVLRRAGGSTEQRRGSVEQEADAYLVFRVCVCMWQSSSCLQDPEEERKWFSSSSSAY